MKQSVAANKDDETSAFKRFNYFYLALKDYPKGKCFFLESDYKYVPNQGDCPAVLYYDENLTGYVIRRYDKYVRAFDTSGKQNVSMVKISKYNGTLLVDGVPYHFVCNTSAVPSLNFNEGEAESVFQSPLTLQTQNVIQSLHSRTESIRSSRNLFVSKSDMKLVNKQSADLEKRLNVILAKTKNL